MEMHERGAHIDDINLLPPGSEYRLGEGHVRFFYDKLLFIYRRYQSLRDECFNRGFVASDQWLYDVEWPAELWNDYEPTKEAILINLRRLTEKFQHKFRPTYSPHVKVS